MFTKALLKSLKEELAQEEKQLKKRQDDVSAKAELNDIRREQQKQQLEAEYQRRFKHKYDIIDYLTQNSVYYRAFNYDAGEYAKNSTLHNQIHSNVTRELKDVLKRSLGFFLRSDRHYPQKGFDQKKIFSYGSVKRKEHLWTMAFNTSEIQYQDMYEFLVQQRYHYLRELGNYYNRKNKGLPVDSEPSDPIKPYEELLNKLFPYYRFADTNEEVPSNFTFR